MKSDDYNELNEKKMSKMLLFGDMNHNQNIELPWFFPVIWCGSGWGIEVFLGETIGTELIPCGKVLLDVIWYAYVYDGKRRKKRMNEIVIKIRRVFVTN